MFSLINKNLTHNSKFIPVTNNFGLNLAQELYDNHVKPAFKSEIITKAIATADSAHEIAAGANRPVGATH